MIGQLRYSFAGRALSLAALLLGGAIGLCAVLAPYSTQHAAWTLLSWMPGGGGGVTTLALDAAQPLDDAVAMLLGKCLANHQNIELRVQKTTGTVESANRLRRGDVQLAIVSESPLRGDREGLEAVATLGLRYAHLIVPTDSNVRAFRDLAGKKLGVGVKEGDAALLAADLLTFFQFSEPPALVYDHGPDLERAFLDGKIDAAFALYPLNAPPVQHLLAKGWYRLAPITEAESIAQALPRIQPAVLPNNLYGEDRALPRAEDSPFYTIATSSILAARERISDGVIHAVLSQLYSPAFLSQVPLPAFSEAEGTPPGAWPWHEAAAAYYERHHPVTWRQMAAALQAMAGLAVVSLVARALWRRRERLLYQSRKRSAQRQRDALKSAGLTLTKADSPEQAAAALRQIAAVHQWAEQSLRTRTIPPDLVAELSLALGAKTLDTLNKWAERRPVAAPPHPVPSLEPVTREYAAAPCQPSPAPEEPQEPEDPSEPPGLHTAPGQGPLQTPPYPQKSASSRQMPSLDDEEQPDQLFLF